MSRLCNKQPCPDEKRACCLPYKLLPGGEECGLRKHSQRPDGRLITGPLTTTQSPPAVIVGWAPWSQWSNCTGGPNCGGCASRHRTRTCLGPEKCE